MKTPHPIPYQGSKRLLAPALLNHFPVDASTLFEPFAGAAAVSIAAIRKGKVTRVVLNDINEPLMELWRDIIERPEAIASAYEKLWRAQLGRERKYYDVVRDQFNRTRKPHYLLYLLARCVKASVRYNSEGQFNQSPDNRRRGMNPETMRWHILAASQLLKGRTKITAGDYRETLKTVQPEDIVYMDPPYQGVCANRDPRYIGGLNFEVFAATLRDLNARRISYILSYDGRTGDKSYGKPMPIELDLIRIEIDAGRSSQATLLGRNSNTYESVYLSPALVERIGMVSKRHWTLTPKQLGLLAHNAI
ncbi:MAG: DNA adenine methylase [Acidobacteria bacterium RIFCSPLOWO2_12_FULL_60_22]|nr:MAG: DNA adenine methylase [Acidobacteria bacterium RIFCSPLOWO2_12_FULL_60_22]